ncbi:type II secretion system F family protein [Candidatus Woesearchaeota archaeon]|nr:type II secretion system F family protein [Candidatus Woesearchaeota archaeon]
MFKISLAKRVLSFFPSLKTELRIAKLPYTPAAFVSKSLKTAVIYSLLTSVLSFFVLQRMKLSLFLMAPVFFVLFILFFEYSMIGVKARVRKREIDIDKEVLFIGRYLLVKLYSGRPLLNALMETSESRGITSKYIKEITDDISTGSTIEDALKNAMLYSPSEKLKKIMFHINNALQLGIDVTKPLESVLEEIAKEEELEIKKYGKKLNSLVIFYMLAAVIIPSLGTAIFIVISSLLSFPIGLSGLLVFAFFIGVLQFVFISMFKIIRPKVSL